MTENFQKIEKMYIRLNKFKSLKNKKMVKYLGNSSAVQ